MIDDTPYQKGVLGEERACEYLCQMGMEPLARRFHSRFGEIDLIMEDRGTLVFVEVKARARGRAYDGANAVHAKKRERLIQTARCYLAEHPTALPVRFDIVELTRDGVLHLPNAFEGREW